MCIGGSLYLQDHYAAVRSVSVRLPHHLGIDLEKTTKLKLLFPSVFQQVQHQINVNNRNVICFREECPTVMENIVASC